MAKRATKKKPEPKDDPNEGFSVINNLEIHKKEGYVLVSVNPRIYPLQIIYSAAYVLMDRAYIILGGDPQEEVLVEIRPKSKRESLEKLGREFNNELINYAVYTIQTARNQDVRDAIVRRAFLTNENAEAGADPCGCPPSEGASSYRDDPEGIAKPWSGTEE